MSDMKFVGMVGAPASGKSTIMRQVLSRLPDPEDEFFHNQEKVYGPVKGTLHPSDGRYDPVFLLGEYQGEGFDGTDRLSLSVGPNVRWLMRNPEAVGLDGYTWLWEGDRLAVEDTMREAEQRGDLNLIVLDVDDEVLEDRWEDREQDPTWLKGRRTKVKNIRENFDCLWVPNNNEKDLEANVNLVSDILRGEL